ncbi:hypothetical protein JW960_26390 [candidate division KSB1 bacterium]|nr:hypothetical protein [candidate division KSB1 bacterium]
MEKSVNCAYCGKGFAAKTMPFVPANSMDSFHWKCYIQSVKERRKTDEYEELSERVKVVEVHEVAAVDEADDVDESIE